MGLRRGDRVRVRSGAEEPHDTGWPTSFAGTVATMPNGWGTVKRVVTTETGQQVFYYIRFDSPQVDSDGDGPYVAGEILVQYLERESS